MKKGTRSLVHYLNFEPGRTTGTMQDDASYVCDSCGEEIVVPVDLSQGSHQRYLEDCPVCCHPNVISIEVEEVGEVRIWSEGE